MAQSQKAATYAAIVLVMTQHGHEFTEGMNVAPVMSKELRSEVRDILVKGFQAGEIELDKQYDTIEALNSYTSGLISNWIRKDARLNGGGKYVPKNPGTRTGSGDDQLKALKALLANVSTPEERAEIQGYIDARVSELQKAKAPTVDLSKLPEALRAKYTA